MNINEIEQAALASWPATEEIVAADIVLRSNGGYTKRANCANILNWVGGDARRLIRQGEVYLQSHGLPVIFRLLSSIDVTCIDTPLAALGYEKVETTLVLTASMANSEGPETPLKICRLSPAEWVEAFYEISRDEKLYPKQHLEILKRIESDAYTAAIKDASGRIVAMGIGVVKNGYFGIFNIVTSQAHLKMGYAYQLISELKSWASSRQAHSAYVQVREDNHGAVNLYKKLGYQPAYSYWYRIGGKKNV